MEMCSYFCFACVCSFFGKGVFLFFAYGFFFLEVGGTNNNKEERCRALDTLLPPLLCCGVLYVTRLAGIKTYCQSCIGQRQIPNRRTEHAVRAKSELTS